MHSRRPRTRNTLRKRQRINVAANKSIFDPSCASRALLRSCRSQIHADGARTRSAKGGECAGPARNVDRQRFRGTGKNPRWRVPLTLALLHTHDGADSAKTSGCREALANFVQMIGPDVIASFPQEILDQDATRAVLWPALRSAASLEHIPGGAMRSAAQNAQPDGAP